MRHRATWCRSLAAGAALALVQALAHPHVADANPLLLFSPETGQVLYAEEPDRLWHPASITKLMTAYLTFDAVKTGRLAWDDDVPLSEHARAQPATRIGLRAGIHINVEQAVRGLILRSANDFAVALAERVGGREDAFVLAMNDTARRLGMTRTVFRNPHGLPDPEQVTTARDLAILTTALFRDFPDRAEVFSTPTVRIHKGTFHSHNDLLRALEGADGMKTGFTCASGYNVVASATRNGNHLVAIVLGEYNRQRRSARATELIEAGFAHLSGDPALMAAVNIPPPAPFRLRHAGMAPLGTPRPFRPVTLRTMPASPTAAEPPGNIGRDVRTRTCLGYSGFAKPEAEHDHDAENDADDLVTGSVTPAAAAGAVVKPSPAAPAAAAHPAPPKPRRAAALVRKTAQPRPPRAPVRAPVKRNADLSGGASSAALHDNAPLTAPPSVGP